MICCHITGRSSPDARPCISHYVPTNTTAALPGRPHHHHLASCVGFQRVANTNPKIRKVSKVDANPSIPNSVPFLALVAVLGFLSGTLIGPLGRRVVVALPVLGRVVAVSVRLGRDLRDSVVQVSGADHRARAREDFVDIVCVIRVSRAWLAVGICGKSEVLAVK